MSFIPSRRRGPVLASLIIYLLPLAQGVPTNPSASDVHGSETDMSPEALTPEALTAMVYRSAAKKTNDPLLKIDIEMAYRKRQIDQVMASQKAKIDANVTRLKSAIDLRMKMAKSAIDKHMEEQKTAIDQEVATKKTGIDHEQATRKNATEQDLAHNPTLMASLLKADSDEDADGDEDDKPTEWDRRSYNHATYKANFMESDDDEPDQVE